MPNENIVGGYYGDPVVYYGPSLFAAEAVGSEGRVYGQTPIYGPASPGANNMLPSPKQFFTSPAGLVVLLTLGGFIAWKYVFGE